MTAFPAALKWQQLTLGQLDFWQESCAHPGSPVSTVAHATRFSGALDPKAILAAIGQVIAETDAMALRFRLDEDGWVTQAVDPAMRPQIQSFDLQHEPDPEAAANRLMQQDIDSPVHLTKGGLSAHMLIRTGAQTWTWYFRGHHIFLDGYSMALIERRVAQIYNEQLGHTSSGKGFAPLSDYLEEETAYSASGRYRKDAAFWNDYLSEADDLEILRKGDEDYPPAPYEGAVLLADIVPQLRQMSDRIGIGWPELLTLLAALWLWGNPPEARRKPQAPLTVWLPFMGRMGSVSATIPAMVVNILPFRVQPDADLPFEQQILALARDLRRLRRHGRYRIEQISADREIGLGHRFFFSPLINVLPFDSPEFIGCRAERQVLAAGPGDGFNISFLGRNDASGLELVIEADPARMPADQFDDHMRRFPDFIARALLADPQIPLGRLLSPQRETIGDAV